jgi:hypothetical protein
MAVKVLELKSSRSTREIESLDEPGLLDVQTPLTAAGWLLVDIAQAGDSVVVTSADGDKFIGEVAGVDEDRYVITVELS